MNAHTMPTGMSRLWSRTFILIMVANALLFMVFEMMLPTLPLFVSRLGGSTSQIGLVTGIFMFSAILIRPFAAKLAARFDKKYLLAIGLAICALMTGGYYLSTGIGMLLVFRLLHGVGFGLATTYFATLATASIPRERRGEGMGYFGVGETVAVSIGPLIGTAILMKYDFQSLFFGGALVLLLALVMTLMIARSPKESIDATHAETPFKLIEKRVLFPSLLIMLVGIVAGSIMSFIALYAIDQGFTAVVAWFFFIVAAAGFLVRLVSGRMFDRFGPGSVLVPSALFIMAGLWLITQSGGEAMFLGSAVLYGFGFGAVFPAIQTWCVNLVGEHEHEDAMASFFNFFDLGIGGGSMILGLVASAFSYEVVYNVAIGVMVVYLLLYAGYAMRTGKKRA